ncbi:MAG: BamA/TamA family outer membrane protein [Bacteroidota bacterium]
MRRLAVLCLLLLVAALDLEAQHIYVDTITVIGNKRTHGKIIFRELDFTIGDSISLLNLAQVLERNRLQILNARLFSNARMNIKTWDERTNRVGIEIEVNESWYLYPIPIFELADRNFNVWWVDQNRDLDRINLGIRFYHLNITGRGDLLKAVGQFGYTQKYELEYSLPSFNKAQTFGLKTNLFFSRNREVNYTTFNNKQEFERVSDDFLLRRLRGEFRLIYRPAIFFYHEAGIEIHSNRTTDFVSSELNPDFFLDGRQEQQFLALRYALIYDRRDIKPYPLHGFYIKSVLRKDGLGFYDDRDALTLTTTYAQYFPITSRLNLEWILKAHIFFIREQQPYYNSRALGYGPDFLRGYELYVIDGLDFGYSQSSLRYELFDGELQFGPYMPLKKLKVMPLRVYLSLNNDLGYTNDPYYQEGNPMTNRLLYGGGIGLDIITFYDKVTQIQFSVNHLGEKGLFLHHKFIF